MKTYNDCELLRRELHTQSARIEEVERQLLQLIAHQESELKLRTPNQLKVRGVGTRGARGAQTPLLKKVATSSYMSGKDRHTNSD